jgi:hypothetical protein
MKEFAALHAQRLADKMVEERTKEEPKIRVAYSTELNGPQEKVLELSELLRFINRFDIIALEWFRSRMK